MKLAQVILIKADAKETLDTGGNIADNPYDIEKYPQKYALWKSAFDGYCVDRLFGWNDYANEL